jgi:hypothetical protein
MKKPIVEFGTCKIQKMYTIFLFKHIIWLDVKIQCQITNIRENLRIESKRPDPSFPPIYAIIVSKCYIYTC